MGIGAFILKEILRYLKEMNNLHLISFLGRPGTCCTKTDINNLK